MSGLPGVPQIQFQPTASLSTLEFWWQAPLNNGGALIQNYSLICSTIPYSTIIGPSSFYAKVNPLVNAQNYTFQLAAINTNGRGPYIAYTTAQPGTQSSVPTGLNVNQNNPSTATLSWNFSQGPTESRNRYFVVTVIPSTQSASMSTFQIPVYADQRSLTVRNLSTMNYTFLVQAVSDNASWCFPNASTLNYVGPSNVFSPSLISTLNFWLDGADPLATGTPPAVSTTLTNWLDKSENAVVPTVSGPSANGLTYMGSTNGVVWTGNTCLVLPTQPLPLGGSPFTTFVAFNPAGNNALMVYSNGNGQNLQLRGSDLNMFGTAGDLTVAVPIANQAAFAKINYESTIRRGGYTFNFTSTNYNTAVTYNTSGNQNIGMWFSNQQIYVGRYYEFLSFNRHLAPYPTQVVEGYLANKWNFTNYMPSTHPYKSIAPTTAAFTSPPIFDPTFIKGLRLWLDGNDPAGSGFLPSNGSAVTTWRDKSGWFYNLNMTNTPTYATNIANGNAAISFSGTQYGTVAIPAQTFIAALDVFVVYRFTGAAPTYSYIFDRSAAPVNSGSGTISNFNGSVSVANNGAIVTYVTQYNTSLSIMNCRISQASSATSFYEQFSNGTLQSVVSGSPAAGFTPYDASPNFSVGSARSTTNFAGFMCEVVAFNVYLNVTQRQQMEGYLAWKWGLQASLPGGHPFSAASPVGTPYAGP